MDGNRIAQLTERHREVLRLKHRRLRVKEIAATLGISANTASSYLSEAATLLDAGGREGAAAALARFEAAHPQSRGRFSAGDEAPPPPPPVGPAAPQAEPAAPWRALLPLRMGSPTNDLPVLLRLGWIVLLAILLAIGFGSLASAVHVVSELARGGARG